MAERAIRRRMRGQSSNRCRYCQARRTPVMIDAITASAPASTSGTCQPQCSPTPNAIELLTQCSAMHGYSELVRWYSRHSRNPKKAPTPFATNVKRRSSVNAFQFSRSLPCYRISAQGYFCLAPQPRAVKQSRKTSTLFYLPSD